MVGLIPLFAVETLEPEIVERLPGFQRRMQWFIDNHPDVPEHIEMTAALRSWRAPFALPGEPQSTEAHLCRACWTKRNFFPRMAFARSLATTSNIHTKCK